MTLESSRDGESIAPRAQQLADRIERADELCWIQFGTIGSSPYTDRGYFSADDMTMIVAALKARISESLPSDEAVMAAAKAIAASPLIDVPKLTWPSWMGLARHTLQAAMNAAPQGDGEGRDAGNQPQSSAPVVSAPGVAAPSHPEDAEALPWNALEAIQDALGVGECKVNTREGCKTEIAEAIDIANRALLSRPLPAEPVCPLCGVRAGVGVSCSHPWHRGPARSPEPSEPAGTGAVQIKRGYQAGLRRAVEICHKYYAETGLNIADCIEAEIAGGMGDG